VIVGVCFSVVVSSNYFVVDGVLIVVNEGLVVVSGNYFVVCLQNASKLILLQPGFKGLFSLFDWFLIVKLTFI
jgi:hypothetical protein